MRKDIACQAPREGDETAELLKWVAFGEDQKWLGKELALGLWGSSGLLHEIIWYDT